MKNFLGLVLFLSVFVSGCATFPSPEESSGGLLALPLEVNSEVPGQFSFIYTMVIVDENGNVVDHARVDPNVYKHSYVLGPLPSGTYTIKELYSRPVKTGNNRYTYKDNAVEIGIDFSIEEDVVTELRYVFTVNREKKSNGFSTWFNFVDEFSSGDLRDRYLTDLGKRVDLAAWELSR